MVNVQHLLFLWGHNMTDNEIEACRRWANGEDPDFSTGICSSLTAGYGKLDENGYFEFPLHPAEHYLEELKLERIT